MKDTGKQVRAELKRIAAQNGGVLMPVAVVEAARPPASPLHSKFDWDDSVAAEKYRLWQARQLIAITVNVIGSDEQSDKVWVSLTTDRRMEGGYRPLVSVLANVDLRAQLLRDALDDLEVFREKYGRLKELAAVFAAVRKVKRKTK